MKGKLRQGVQLQRQLLRVFDNIFLARNSYVLTRAKKKFSHIAQINVYMVFAS